MTTVPNVLCLSGHDPSGGAGLQADIEAIAAQGAHAAGVLTCLTQQDTRNAYGVMPVDLREFAAQIEIVAADMPLAAIKVGLVADPGQVDVIADLARARPEVPLVVDPVLRAGGGATLAADPVARALEERLFGHALCITPNADEARLLCPEANDLDDCGRQLAGRARWALITGGDLSDREVVNRLYAGNDRVARYTWPRLPGRYHGSGCTLSSALAGRLARGETLETAVAAAQEYTWQSLARGFAAGGGQLIPDRLDRYRGPAS